MINDSALCKFAFDININIDKVCAEYEIQAERFSDANNNNNRLPGLGIVVGSEMNV